MESDEAVRWVIADCVGNDSWKGKFWAWNEIVNVWCLVKHGDEKGQNELESVTSSGQWSYVYKADEMRQEVDSKDEGMRIANWAIKICTHKNVAQIKTCVVLSRWHDFSDVALLVGRQLVL